jgi:hypothetical protein
MAFDDLSAAKDKLTGPPLIAPQLTMTMIQ